MSAANTIPIRVGPGEQTGYYHITMANLPFGTSWQALRAWFSTVCEVEHIEVFPHSTSGWVRVYGEHNFHRAWGLLSGGTFNGRSLVADDKNRTQSITIRETAQSPQYPLGSDYTQGSDYNQGDVVSYAGQAPAAQGYTYAPAFTATGATSATYPATGPEEYYAYAGYVGGTISADHSTAAYAAYNQSGNAPYTLPYYGESATQPQFGASDGTQFAASQTEPPQQSYVATEQRKVYVSGFKQHIRFEDVKYWIRRRVGLSNRISSIEIPMSNNNRSIRGHAFVIFETAEGASNGVDLLNNSKYEGCSIKARLTAEGVVVGEQGQEVYRPKHSKPHQAEYTASQEEPVAGPSTLTDDQLYGAEVSQRSSYKDSKGKNRESGKKKGPSKKSGKKKDKMTSSSSSSSKKKSSDKKPDTDPGPPIVVNGSSLPYRGK